MRIFYSVFDVSKLNLNNTNANFPKQHDKGKILPRVKNQQTKNTIHTGNVRR